MTATNINKLRALQVKKASKTGRYSDGNCLYLYVDDNASKRWVLRLVVRGKRRDMGLGSAALVNLEDKAPAVKCRHQQRRAQSHNLPG